MPLPETNDKSGTTHYLDNLIRRFDTGWIVCNDWTNQSLGNTVGANLVHSLHGNLSSMIVQVFVSSDATENNAVLINGFSLSADDGVNWTASQVDADTLTVNTGTLGLVYADTDGTVISVANGWYYKVVVYKITPRVG